VAFLEEVEGWLTETLMKGYDALVRLTPEEVAKGAA
jgi:hypothetical protein